MKKILSLLIILGLLMTFAVNIGITQEEEGGTYRAGWLAGCGAISSLATTCTHRLDMTVLQPLAGIKWTADDVQPLLAESWDMEEDGKVWIFHLREGVTWHDGEPFTADDVVFSFNAYVDPAVGSRWHVRLSDILGYDEFRAGEADSLEGVTKVDDMTVRVELKNAAPLWILLSQPYIIIFPNHLLGDVPAEELIGHDYWSSRVGTGPFKWENYEPDQFIELVRNEDYFLGAPKLERVIYQFYADASTHLAALENGEIDSIAYETLLMPVPEVARFEGMDNIFVRADMDMGAPAFLQMDLTDEDFGDVRFRKALMYAIDRKGLVETLWQSEARVANTMFPAEWTWPDDLNQYEYNPDKARELLAEMGWDNSRELDFIYHYSDSLTADLIVAMQQYLADVGINIAPRRLEPATINEMYADGTFEIGYFANGQGLDPATGRTAVQCDSTIAFSYCNERVEELFDEGLKYRTREERAPYYQEISKILNEELPKVWLWYQVRPLAFNTRVKGLVEHWKEQPVILFNIPVYNEIETWYIEE